MAIDNGHVHQLNHKIGCEWMGEHGIFGRMGVQGDGSCFFHSVCAMTNRNNYLYVDSHKQKDIAYEFRCDFRNKFTQEDYNTLSQSKKEEKNFEEVKDGFCVTTTWADEMMINFASKVLNLNLIFMDLSEKKAYCGVHGKDTIDSVQKNKKVTQCMGIVAWVGKVHFEPIVRIDNADEGRITTLFDPSIKKDADFIHGLVSNYIEKCDV